MSSEYRPLDDGGFVPSKPKGNDLLADSDAEGHRGSEGRGGDEEEAGHATCCATAGWLCVIAYLTGWVGGLVIALAEKRNYFVVFHACQSIVVSSIYCTLAVVFALIDLLVIKGVGFSVISLVWFLLYAVLVVVCIIFAWKHRNSGDLFQIVGLGVLAERLADKFFRIGNPNANTGN